MGARRSPPQVDPERLARANRRRLSGPGLRTFLNVADIWKLDKEQQRSALGGPAPSTYRRWCKKARGHIDLTLGADVLIRVSAILGIHQALCTLFAEEEERIQWLFQPHSAPLFGGRPPASFVTSGAIEDLMALRRFLDAARGGLYMPPNAIDVGFARYKDDEISID